MRIIKRIFLTLLAIIVLFAGYILFAMRANVPENQLVLPAASITQSSDSRPVLIFGGTRNTGLELAKLLHGRGERVVAFVRPTSDRAELNALDAEFLEGDAMDMATVSAALSSQSFRAVVTTIGCLNCEPPVDFVANRNVIDAAKQAGVDHVLLVTTIGAGDSVDSTPMISSYVLRKILPLKTQVEKHLAAAGVNYTIIRPGGLGSDFATGNGILSEDRTTFGFINRTDLATLMLSCLDSDACNGKTLAAIDAEKTTPW